MAHCEEVSISVFSSSPQLDSSDELFTETEEIDSDDMSDITAEWQSQVKRFTQGQFKDSVRDSFIKRGF